MEPSERWAKGLVDVLRDAQPSWNFNDLAAVTDRLAQAGIESPGALADALGGQLNERLRRKGMRTFKAETVKRLQSSLERMHPELQLIASAAGPPAFDQARQGLENSLPGFALHDALIGEVLESTFSSLYLFKSPLQRTVSRPAKVELHQVVQLLGPSGVLQFEYLVGGVRYQRKAKAEVFRDDAKLVCQTALPPPSDEFGSKHVAEVLATWLKCGSDEKAFIG
eukprot:CAMPEP_0180640496 /NCGR_PEP_ID=MMETSP1037_2-20121125/45829_1 /TAXON_ID=632150 /ORGANISM="Azadinium spinosum, Strain 3D9" /LENGTH=223 /DNA_ID=CAMNT_0022662975 /DNA_START=22 /DNA_END=690 /DNA_ORIENTATION=-